MLEKQVKQQEEGIKVGAKFSRRDFVKLLGGTAVASAGLSFSFSEARALPAPKKKLIEGQQINTICTYCGVGCGIIATAIDGKVVNIEGDVEHPINQGRLCSKGNAQLQLYGQNNPLRLTKPKMRTNPKKGEGEDPKWKEISWEEAFKIITEKTKAVVDEFYKANPLPDKDGNYIIDGKKFPIAWFGSAYSHNEENYLFRKLSVLLGTNNIEHQARRCHSTTVGALAATFGFGAMTNHIIDVKNANVIMIMGSNTAEQHPIYYGWVMRAKERGAKLIVLDPRFTRSASKADIFTWFRPGTDAAVMLGLINYAITNNLVDSSYVAARTDAEKEIPGVGKVMDKLIAVASNYTIEEVSRISGIPKEKFKQIAELYCKTKPGAILYAMGTTQHTNGTQMIRAYAILQLLLGNIGVPGGGVDAIRGISNVQGSTDMGTLFEWLPGYRRAPTGAADLRNFQKYKNMRKENVPVADIVTAFKFAAPLDLRHWATWRDGYMKFWGIYAGTYPEEDPDKGVVISDLPIGLGNSAVEIFREIKKGTIKVLFVVGENPAVSVANLPGVKDALKSEGVFTVVMDMFESETGHFADILLPAASVLEKDGTVTNTGRWVQWRNATQAPPGEAKSDLWFAAELFKRLRKAGAIVLPSEKFAKDKGIAASALGVDPDTKWNYGDPPKAEEVLKEMNSVVAIYSGVVTAEGKIRPKSRDNKPADEMDAKYGMFKNWAFSWPDNQRVLYKTDETNILPRALGANFFTADKKAMIYNPVAYPGPRLVEYAIPVHNEPAESPDPELAKKYPPIIGTHIAAPAANKDLSVLKVGDSSKYPIVLTTYRLTEHMHTGMLSRNLPWLGELFPEVFIEISPSLAGKLGVKTGDLVSVKSARKPDGIKVKAIVTNRVRPLTINGKLTEIVAMPWHWGFKGLYTGASANEVTIDAVDAWTRMPETKVALCSVEKA